MENYTLHQRGEVKWLTFPQLDRYSELTHLFTTRHGGVSTGPRESWNFGKGPDESWENISENYRILAKIMAPEQDPESGINRMVRTDQTHSANVLKVTEEHLGMGIMRERTYTDIDGLVTNRPGITLITSHGDCNALFFYDPKNKAIGLAHSGWRGTLWEIGAEVVRMMHAEYGCKPEDIIVGIGPALCQECFEVDEDVARMFYEKHPKSLETAWHKTVKPDPIGPDRSRRTIEKHYIDLKGVVRDILLGAGVQPQNIYDMELCTKCRPDLFYSYRGQKGRNGNMVAAMRLKPEGAK